MTVCDEMDTREKKFVSPYCTTFPYRECENCEHLVRDSDSPKRASNRVIT